MHIHLFISIFIFTNKTASPEAGGRGSRARDDMSQPRRGKEGVTHIGGWAAAGVPGGNPVRSPRRGRGFSWAKAEGGAARETREGNATQGYFGMDFEVEEGRVRFRKCFAGMFPIQFRIKRGAVRLKRGSRVSLPKGTSDIISGMERDNIRHEKKEKRKRKGKIREVCERSANANEQAGHVTATRLPSTFLRRL